MNKTIPSVALAILVASGCAAQAAEAPAASSQPANRQTKLVVNAATAFLDSLPLEQRAKVQFPFTPQKTATAAKFQRRGRGPGGGPGGPRDFGGPGGDPGGAGPGGGGPGGGEFAGFVVGKYGDSFWSNFPVSDVPRPGLRLGPGHDGEMIDPEGLKAAAMTDQQKSMLLDLMSEWAGIVNDGFTAPRIADIKATLNDTDFAWSGLTTHQPGRNGTAYYRIQGRKVVIEFSPHGVGGDKTMHVHTVYRDPTDEYGRASTNPQ